MIFTLTLNPALDKELTVDNIVFGEVLPALNCRVDPGGKGFNVSRLLKELGTESTAMRFIGGSTGEQLEKGLSALGITSDLVRIDGETRTNTSIVCRDQGEYIKVNEKGPVISPASQHELLEKIRSKAEAEDWWVLSGSLPPGVDVSIYREIISILNSKNCRTILDTSGEALKHGVEVGPYLVKPNLAEARDLTGLKINTITDMILAAGKIKQSGAQNVVISNGADGAFLHADSGAWYAHSPEVQEKNPIGAGDAMIGGIVQKLSLGLSLEEAFRYGVACGAAAASQSGTNPGSLQLIENLLPQVEIGLIG